MAPRGEERGLMGFVKRVGIVAGAFLGCVAVTSMLLAWATAELRAADKATNERIDRLVKVVELAVTIQIEPDSTLKLEALRDLRKLRKVTD